jgi:uncharacterized protein YbjQ (UPF0145 family)
MESFLAFLRTEEGAASWKAYVEAEKARTEAMNRWAREALERMKNLPEELRADAV